MKRRFFHFFLLLCFLGPLCAAAQETRNSDEGEALPTVVYLSLPASISAVLENPERAEQLFQTYTYPRNVLLYQLEKEIEKESAKAGKEEASKALLSRKRQNLIAKVEYLYLKANTDRRLMRRFLLLNGLTGDLPARADDNVYEILALRLWIPDKLLEAETFRRRPEAQLKNSTIIKHLIRIQLNLAKGLCESVPDTLEARTAALIELSNIAAIPPPEIDCGKASDPISKNDRPIYEETSFPILDLYTNLFHLTDWTPF